MSEEGANQKPELLGASNYEIWAMRIEASTLAAKDAKDLYGFWTRAEVQNPKLREQGGKDRRSDSAKIVTAAQDADLEDLLTNWHSDLPVAAHSPVLHSAWPVASHSHQSDLYSDLLMASHTPPLSHSDLPVAAHSPVLHSAWPDASHSDLSMGGPALSAKHSSGDWILDFGAESHICCEIGLFDKIAPTWGNSTTLPARGKGTVMVTLPNSASAVLKSVLYMPELRHNIISLPRLIRKGASISFTEEGPRIYFKSGAELFATTNANGLFYLPFKSTQILMI